MSRPTLAVVRNVAACANLGTEVALDRLQAGLGENNCRRVASKINMDVLYVACTSLSKTATASVYASGQMTLAGAKSESEARLFARKVARMVHLAGFPEVRFSGFRVTTLSATYHHGKTVRLEGIKHQYEDYVTFEPEMHPALSFRIPTGAVIQVYTNGKCSVTGVKSHADAELACERIAAILKNYERSEQL